MKTHTHCVSFAMTHESYKMFVYLYTVCTHHQLSERAELKEFCFSLSFKVENRKKNKVKIH